MKKFYTIVLGIIVSLSAVSCLEEKQEPWTPGPQEDANNYGVFFPVQDASGAHTYDPDMATNVKITVSRTNTSGAIEVPFTSSVSEEGIFNFGTINFADGQSETTLTVNFPTAKQGTTYSFSIQIDPAYSSFYNSGDIALDFSVLIVAWQYILNPKTGEKALFTFDQAYWGETAYAYVKYYEVDGVRTCHTESTINHIYNTPYEGWGFWGNAEAEGEGELYFNIYTEAKNADGNMFVELLPNPVYLHSSYNEIVYVFDYYYYWTVYQDSLGNPQGLTLSWLEFAQKYQASYPVGYYDNNGGLFFYTRSYGMYGLGGWTSDMIDIVGIAEGFVRVDYSLEIEADYPADGVTPIYIEAGKDVASVNYAVYPGALNSAQMDAKLNGVKEGTEEVQSFSTFVLDDETATNYGTLGLSPAETGTYTLIMVALDGEGTIQNSATLIFDHVSAADNEEYAVNITLFTEPTPDRYAVAGYNEYNSFAYGLYGENVTEAHVAVVKSASLSNALLQALKEDATTAVDEDVLAEINEVGGYYNVVTGLTPGTEYAVVVWATNGSREVFDYELYATTPSPEVWEHYGTVTFTDVFIGPWFGQDPPVYDLNVDRSVDDPARFRILNVYGEPYPLNDPGDWDDSKDYYLVINTQDPEYIWIETFDSGTDWGYGNFLLTSQIARYVDSYSLDILKANDIPGGVINGNTLTFAPQAILKAMANYNNGGWYYGNSDEWSLTFVPGATLTAPVAPVVAPKRSFGSADAFRFRTIDGQKREFERDAKAINVETVDLAPARIEKTTLRNNTAGATKETARISK
ncbi:MAG: hypothetical protein J6W94_03485 [Bacteroidales bacterium]|nr:hypothetical protein [Bacteroidales bacterium]